MESVREFANEFKQQFKKLNILICNAGVMIPLRNKCWTKDGFESNLGINHLGHFLLTNLLLEPIKNAAPSR
jgi:NAD(P)-dependent dehydrogenase (short-subunit alcohol dehydrogenase family)